MNNSFTHCFLLSQLRQAHRMGHSALVFFSLGGEELLLVLQLAQFMLDLSIRLLVHSWADMVIHKLWMLAVWRVINELRLLLLVPRIYFLSRVQNTTRIGHIELIIDIGSHVLSARHFTVILYMSVQSWWSQKFDVAVPTDVGSFSSMLLLVFKQVVKSGETVVTIGEVTLKWLLAVVNSHVS